MTESKIIPMIYDKVFKSVLTSKEGRWYLIDLISNITGIPKDKMERSLRFKNSEHTVLGINEKKKISDIVIEIQNAVINLEMNKDYYDGIINKNYDYIIKIKQEITHVNEEYDDTKTVIQINFDNYNLYKPDERVVIKFQMLDKEKLLEEGVGIESYHVILPNVREKYYNSGGEIGILERELMIMMTDNDEELKKLIKDNLELKKVGDKVVDITREEELKGLYDYDEQQRKIRNSIMASSIRKGYYKGYDEGMEKGMEKGIEQGIEQGIERGIERGKKEGRKEGKKEGAKANAIMVAEKLLKKGFTIDEISEITGLSKKDIKCQQK